MAYNRLTHLDLSTRLTLVLEVLHPIPERQWERATELARSFSISRTLLYQLHVRVAAVIVEALSPHQPGPGAQEVFLILDRAFIQQAVVILSLLKGTVRDIQKGLPCCSALVARWATSVSLNAAGAKATAQSQALVVPVPILGEADEIFQGRKPCLTLVDGRSFRVRLDAGRLSGCHHLGCDISGAVGARHPLSRPGKHKSRAGGRRREARGETAPESSRLAASRLNSLGEAWACS